MDLLAYEIICGHFHLPFSSLNSRSAKILHLRSYLSCACSCSIFRRRLMVSVLIPGLETVSSSKSIDSCCKVQGSHTKSTGKFFVCVVYEVCKLKSHLVVGKHWITGVLYNTVFPIPWLTAEVLCITFHLYHLEWWLHWSCCASLGGHLD